MQELQAHPSLAYHQHPHNARSFTWEDGLLLLALLTLIWLMKPVRMKGKKVHGLGRQTHD